MDSVGLLVPVHSPSPTPDNIGGFDSTPTSSSSFPTIDPAGLPMPIHSSSPTGLPIPVHSSFSPPIAIGGFDPAQSSFPSIDSIGLPILVHSSFSSESKTGQPPAEACALSPVLSSATSFFAAQQP
jgi:hypothetical protein